MLKALRIFASGRPYPRNAWLVITVGLGLYLLFAFASLNKPIVDDESDYRASALAIAQTGKPIYYMGTTPEKLVPEQVRWVHQSTPYPGFEYGLWHSPAYVYILGIACKFLGTSNWALRIFGMISFLAGWFILTRIIGMLFKDEKRIWITAIFSSLYFLNPLLVQLGLLIDIDTTVVPIATYLFLHEVIRLDQRGTQLLTKSLWLAVILAIAFWAKEFLGIYLGLSLIVFNCLSLRWKEAASSVGVFLGGAALFWTTWSIFCASTDMPLWYFIQFTGSKLARGEGVIFSILREQGFAAALRQICSSLYYILVWQSPFFFILILMALGSRLQSLWHNRKPELFDLLWVFIGIIFAVTQVYRPSILLRYAYPVHAIALLCIAAFIVEICDRIRPFRWLIGVGVSLGISLLLLLFLGDPLIAMYHQGPWAPSAHRLWIFWLLISVVTAIISCLLLLPDPVRQVVTYSLVIGMLGYGLGLDWNQLKGYVTSFSYLNYGERGNDEMALYLSSSLAPDEMPICSKDFGSAQNLNPDFPIRKWYTPDLINSVRSAQDLLENITLSEVKHILWAPGLFRPDAMPIILGYYEPENQIGDFVLLRRSSKIH